MNRIAVTLSRVLLSLSLLGAFFAPSGCSEELTGPIPHLSDPLPGEPLPVAPGVVCRMQHPTEGTPIVVTGRGLAALPVGIPDDPSVTLPSLTLVRHSDPTGAPTEVVEVLYGGTAGLANSELLSWQSQQQMTFLVKDAVRLPDGSEGMLPIGVYDLHVKSPSDKEALSVGAFVVVDRPRVDAVSPGITCLDEGPRTITLSGQTLLQIEGMGAYVSIGGEDIQVSSFEGCSPMAHGALHAELCDTVTVELAPNLVPAGLLDVTVRNPETAACGSVYAEDLVDLRVVRAPVLLGAQPSLVCAAEGTREVLLSGTGLLVIDGVNPTVALLDSSAASLDVQVAIPELTSAGAANCEALATQGHDVQVCAEVSVTIPIENPDAPYLPTLTLTNPAPAGCSGSTSVDLLLVPEPTLERVAAPLTCLAQAQQAFTLYGTGFIGVDDGSGEQLPEVTVGGEAVVVSDLQDCEDLEAVGLTVRRCTQAQLVIEANTLVAPDGSWLQPEVTLTNPAPAGCGAEHSGALTLVSPPSVASAAPPLVCNAQGERAVVVTGAGFLSVEDAGAVQLPTATVGGDPVTVQSLEGCAAVPVAGLLVQQCTIANLLLPAGSGTPTNSTVILTNPAPAACSVDDAEILTIVVPPVLTSAIPAALCLADGARVVELVGTGFLEVEGVMPTFEVNGAAYVLDAMSNCSDLLVDGLSVRECTSMTVTLPREALPAGPTTLTVVNPEPAGCEGVNTTSLVIVGPPEITSLSPSILCNDGAPVLVTLSGTRFMRVDGVLPAVELGATALPSADVSLTNCAALTAEGLALESCDTLSVWVSPSTLSGGSVPITVTNPAPLGCADTASEPLSAVLPPVINAALPALVCTDDGDRSVVLSGERFFEVGGTAPTVLLDGSPVAASASGCSSLSLGSGTYQQCTTVTVTVPQSSLSPGDVLVSLTNPAPIGCGVSTTTILDVPPTLTISGVSPGSVCASAPGTFALTISGDGFLELDGAMPTVTIAGAPYAVDSLSGCSALDVQGSTVESCTSLQVTVTPTSMGLGDQEITIANASPSSCEEGVSGVFFVAPPPTITGVTSPTFCASSGGTIGLVGANFTAGTAVTLENASQTYVGQVSFQNATHLDVTFGGGIEAGTYDVRVSNAGCDDVLASVVSVDPSPLVFFIDPPTVYNGVTTEVTLFTTGLSTTYGASAVELITPSATAIPLSFTVGSRPNRLLTPIPSEDPTNPGHPLPAGTYELSVTSALGCSSSLNGTLNVTDTLSIELEAIEPAFVSPTLETAVTITAVATSPVLFESTPRVYLNPNPAGSATAVGLEAILFDNETTLSAVVPAGLSPGAYDLIVVNPSGAVGLLTQALTVTVNEPPVVYAVVPGSLDAIADSPAQIRGAFFATDAAGVTVDLECKDTSDTFYQLAATSVVVQDSATIDAILPISSAGVPIGSVCLLTVTNVTEASSFTYSAVAVKNASQNLNSWSQMTPMLEARRALALVAGRPTNTSRFLYAIGGDAGDFTTAKQSVEGVGVGVFGDFSVDGWQLQRNVLPAARTNAGFARVGRFIYLTGGADASQSPTTSTLRAEILDPLAGPEIVDMDADLLSDMGLASGLYFYRVSATFPSTDPSNPGGESLPGEVLTVQLPTISGGITLTLKWDAVPGANGYRVYKALPETDGGAGPFELFYETTCGDFACTCGVDLDCRAMDDRNSVTDSARVPLPRGSLGVWHPTTAFHTAREGHATAALHHPSPLKADTTYLYVVGGRNSVGNVVNSYEFAQITVQSDGSQVIGPWTVGTKTIGAAKADLAAWVVSPDDTVWVDSDSVYLFVGTGVNNTGNPVSEVTSGWLDEDSLSGELRTWDAVAFDGEKGPSSARGAACFGTANGFIFTFGGFVPGDLANDRSAELVNGPEVPDLANVWQAPGGGDLITRRSYCATAQESAFFFTAGGRTVAEPATDSVETTTQ